MRLSALTFQRQFSRFERKVRAQSNGQAFTSFQGGLPAEWEEYKQDVRKEALRLLGFRGWKKADVGKGRILKNAIKAIEIDGVARNNLVNWPNRFGHKNRSHRALLDAQSDAAARRKVEQWFFDFFHRGVPYAEAFEQIRELVGDRYDLVAYLFFLKDSSQFMPIAPTTFDKAFQLLGVDLVTARHCSWENYARYNGALLEVQRALREIAEVDDARLIDAHSFCWMLVRLELPALAPAVAIPLPKATSGLEAVPLQSDPLRAETDFDTVGEEQFAQRDAERRRRGRLAQDIALQSEWRRLGEAGHLNPQDAAMPVWDEPGRGYDILSCELDGTPRYIEVKSARQSGRKLSFFLTQNEWRKSRSLRNYRFYLVLDAESRKPEVLEIQSAEVAAECLAPVNYLASLQASNS